MRFPSLSKSRECQTSQSRPANALLASDMCSPLLIEVAVPKTIGSEPQAIRISLQIPRNVRLHSEDIRLEHEPFNSRTRARATHRPVFQRLPPVRAWPCPWSVALASRRCGY